MAEPQTPDARVEEELREAVLRDSAVSAGRATEQAELMRRVHQRMAARDVLGFGFAHLLTSCLIVFTGAFRLFDSQAAKK